MTKANDGTGNNPSRDEWQTPQWLFDKLNNQYSFSFDCCASKKNTKCVEYSNDFEKRSFVSGVCWMNPPFSNVGAMFEKFFDIINDGVAIYRCDNFETKVWQEKIFPNASWVFIPNKRIVYEGQDGKGARFPSALIGKNVDPPKELEGTLLIPNCEIGGTRKNGE